MSISTTAVIIGLVLGVLLAAAMVIWRRRYHDLFGGFLVLGLLALAIVVMIYQVNQYHEQRAASAQIAQAQPPEQNAGSGSSLEPMANPPSGTRIIPPAASGLRGAAAPPAVHPPAAGNP